MCKPWKKKSHGETVSRKALLEEQKGSLSEAFLGIGLFTACLSLLVW